MRTILILIAALAPLSLSTASQAQVAGAAGLVGSGVAGPMTAHGGVRDQFNAGRAIPYSRLAVGGVTRPARPPRDRYNVYNPYGPYALDAGYVGDGYGYGGGGPIPVAPPQPAPTYRVGPYSPIPPIANGYVSEGGSGYIR